MKKEIVFDIKAWLVVLILLPLGVSAKNLKDKLILVIAIWLILMLLFYPHKWLLKTYLSNKKWLKYGIGLILLVSGVTIPFVFLLNFVDGGEQISLINAFLGNLLLLFFLTAFNYAYKGILLQIQYEKTKRRQVEAELKLLQSQVNPHFLFNTLNNIYSQNLNNHEEANEMILQMADLMRYQIESSKKNEVNIHDEIEFLENYIALEKHRVTDRIKVSFVVDNAENVDLTIPPMLFIPFIENAYKHGISAEGECFITIFLGIKSDSISFKTENTIPLRKQKVKSTNTGLENIKKRLDLLFPEKHRLDITADNQTYKVQLDIKI
jgi:two-component system, LytTR family, sensor kinase